MTKSRKHLIYDSILLLIICIIISTFSFFICKFYVELEFERKLDTQTKVIRDRTYKLSGEAIAVLDGIQANPGKKCGPEQIKLFQRAVFKANVIHVVGYIDENGRMPCSSMGLHNPPIHILAAQQPSSKAYEIYLKASLFNIGNDLTFIKKSNFALFFRNSVLIDFPKFINGVEITAIYVSTHNILLSDANFDKAWMKTIGSTATNLFYDNSYLIGSRLSVDGSLQFVATVHTRHIEKEYKMLFLKTLPLTLTLIICCWFSYIFWRKTQYTVIAKLKKCLDHKSDLYLEYQPVINLSTKKCVGAEALIRWRNEDGNLISPVTFIPIAEQNGIMPQLTMRVLDFIKDDCVELFKKYPDFHIAINISAQDLMSKRVHGAFMNMVGALKVSPHNFILEVTERAVLNSPETKKTFSEIRNTGSTIAIDDFGTGYSSLSYLGDFEVDYLKIDKSFVDTIGTDAPTSKVAVHIIGIAKSLSLQMIAEGIETPAQEKYLVGHKVQFAQGWLYSKSLRIEQLSKYLETHH